jgi:hypothetical protein
MIFDSILRRSIRRGLQPGRDLAKELRELGAYVVKSRGDAQAICEALDQLPASAPTNANCPLRSLVTLFQNVPSADAPAFRELYVHGVPRLIRVLDQRIVDSDANKPDDLLLLLKILAMYGSREGAEQIVRAARRPFAPDSYMWHVILAQFSHEHPHREYVFDALSEPMPPGFIGVALLDSANSAAIVGTLPRHPFNSASGRKRLQDWLEDDDPERASYAHSTTAALPFIDEPDRNRLLELALDHFDAGVQMEAAWAAARLGREAGLRILARDCLDVNRSDTAQRYLNELSRPDLIPADAQEPGFRARAEFANWLAHPNELGRAPDEVEIVDHRMLAWPPERSERPFWLIRFRMQDETGLNDDRVECGLVGGMTWCFFTYKLHQRPPEDGYAIHCCWEMEHAGLIEQTDVTNSKEYAGMLGQWSGTPLTDARITKIAELSPKLGHPARLVALASATLDGCEGWAVLDGPRSTWYPRDEQPGDTGESVVLRIHVGRHLLGLTRTVDRRSYLSGESPQRDPKQIIAAYEKLLAIAESAPTDQQARMLAEGGPLGNHFDAYTAARAAVTNVSRSVASKNLFQRFLAIWRKADESIRGKLIDVFSVLGRHFDSQIDILVSDGAIDEVVELIGMFAPYWRHNLGYRKLGSAAFKAGQRGMAEEYFLSLREGLKSYHRAEEMSMLAEIWFDRGEQARAADLLVDCMTGLIREIQGSKYNSDRETFAAEYQHHRSTYLRLFPDGQSALTAKELPDSPF